MTEMDAEHENRLCRSFLHAELEDKGKRERELLFPASLGRQEAFVSSSVGAERRVGKKEQRRLLLPPPASPIARLRILLVSPISLPLTHEVSPLSPPRHGSKMFSPSGNARGTSLIWQG